MITHEAGPISVDRKQSCLRCGYVLADYSRPFAVSPGSDPNPAYWPEGSVTVDGHVLIVGFQSGAMLCETEG